MRNEEVLLRVKEDRNIIHTIKRRKADWIGHILHRNCLPRKERRSVGSDGMTEKKT